MTSDPPEATASAPRAARGAPASADQGVFGRERRALTCGVLLAVASFAAEGMGVVPALPTVVRELGGMPLFGLAFSTFMLAWLLGTVAAGQLADARGPGHAMALGLLGFGAGLLLAAAARGMPLFLAGRALQGGGGGAMLAAAYVAIARGYPDALRARMMALTSSAWIVPAVCGPALSGFVVQHASWRLVFVGVVPLLVITALVVLPPLRALALHEPLGSGARLRTAARLAAGAGLLLGSTSLRRDTGLWLGGALATAALGAALLVPALRALLPKGTLTAQRGLPAGVAVRGVLAFAYFGTEAFVPLGASELRGASPTRAGLVLSAASIGWIAASWVQDREESRFGAAGRAARVQRGFGLLTVGIALIAAGLLTSLPAALAGIGCLVAGAGVGTTYGATTLYCIAEAPRGREGEVSGQLQLAEALCTAAATGLGGAVHAAVEHHGHGPRGAIAAVLGLTLTVSALGIAAALRLRAAEPRRTPEGGA
ncbi:MAG TPA: MFS transporter [Polyangiaceae bacterium]|nr:MFS transporter [Polyangiaceae bacterium]